MIQLGCESTAPADDRFVFGKVWRHLGREDIIELSVILITNGEDIYYIRDMDGEPWSITNRIREDELEELWEGALT